MSRPNVFPHDFSCPCFGCSSRTATCKIDGSCQKDYAGWKAKKSAESAKIRSAKSSEHAFYEMQFSRFDHIAKQKGIPIRGNR